MNSRKIFSDDTVKKAEAGLTLGFDVVERYNHYSHNGHIISSIYLKSVRNSVALPSEWFPEIEVDERVSLAYIVNHKVINKFYADKGFYQPIEKSS